MTAPEAFDPAKESTGLEHLTQQFQRSSMWQKVRQEESPQSAESSMETFQVTKIAWSKVRGMQSY